MSSCDTSHKIRFVPLARLFQGLMSVYQWTITPLLLSRVHGRLFLFASRWNPVIWTLSTFGILVSALVYHLAGKYGQAQTRAWLEGMLIFGPAALWASLAVWIVPDHNNKTVVCAIGPGRVLGAHLHGSITSVHDLEAAALSIISQARRIKYSRVRLYSPLFGREEKEQVWVGWLSKVLATSCPNVRISIAHRQPFNRYITWRYLADFGFNKHVVIENGKAKAACIEISGF